MFLPARASAVSSNRNLAQISAAFPRRMRLSAASGPTIGKFTTRRRALRLRDRNSDFSRYRPRTTAARRCSTLLNDVLLSMDFNLAYIHPSRPKTAQMRHLRRPLLLATARVVRLLLRGCIGRRYLRPTDSVCADHPLLLAFHVDGVTLLCR